MYQERAQQIITDSIKSAIFIDENARTFFQEKDDLNGKREEEISVELYNNFKSAGVSLDIHKFNLGDQTNTSIKNLLFSDRDLVLLDWHLDDHSGEEYSLELLADIVNRPHIHFCAIYTSDDERQFETIFRNVLSYFSGESKEFYDDLNLVLEDIDGLNLIKEDLFYINVKRDLKDAGIKIHELNKNHRPIVQEILDAFKDGKQRSSKCALIKAAIALDTTCKSEKAQICPAIVSYESKTLVINNTIITILNKEENKPTVLLKKLAQQITSQKSSFTQLLGLEMQSILARNSAFIDDNLLSVSENAFIHHRNHYKKEGLEYFFPEFVKNLFLEKINLCLRNSDLTLLESEVMDSFDQSKNATDEELVSMNIFYNSTQLRTQKVSFGDVFLHQTENGPEYYICITALCDCLRSEDKVENKFFFAKGTKISKHDALLLGDGAFISYLNNSRIVIWSDHVIAIEDKHQKYSPAYIKPVQFTIVNPSYNEEGEIIFASLDKDGVKIQRTVTYLTTIKQNYTQRIANHAYSHPLRVGIDFVNKEH